MFIFRCGGILDLTTRAIYLLYYMNIFKEKNIKSILLNNKVIFHISWNGSTVTLMECALHIVLLVQFAGVGSTVVLLETKQLQRRTRLGLQIVKITVGMTWDVFFIMGRPILTARISALAPAFCDYL